MLFPDVFTDSLDNYSDVSLSEVVIVCNELLLLFEACFALLAMFLTTSAYTSTVLEHKLLTFQKDSSTLISTVYALVGSYFL